ncbi:hypothetical protein [Mycolicibacter kumamotonensis]|uniref:Transmembrane protein n=1 Tax=Mycolicibacter kumamotonensis TaxID=354243 RepID=A0A1B8SF50_9MYCO|nr:hypothetical protein [Mycolicibacter kumamotonensis]OBY31371.1 transmembrane protein [Mycolicibacter kumamotonensis]
MLIIALVLAAIGLAALVFAVVTSNALVAWVCIGASLLGVLLLIVDALRERRRISPPAAPEAVEADGDSEAVVDAVDIEDMAADADEDVAEASDAPETADPEAVEDYDGVAVEESDDEPVAHPAD